MHPRQRDALRDGHIRRQTELLEAIAEALDADVSAKDQCGDCGDWFKNVGSHKQHCDGPD